MKLRGKFMLAFLAAGLIPLLLGIWFSHSSVQRALREVNLKARDALAQKAYDQLTALLRSKASQVETYFDTLRNEVLVITHDRAFVQSMTDLHSAFSSFLVEADVDAMELERQREALRRWYAEVFEQEYATRNPGRTVNGAAYVDALNPDAIALQYTYVAQNPHPLAEHRQLLAGDANSRYALVHARVHPFWLRANDKLGFHDIYLITSEPGRVVYSTRKQVDFGASMESGPVAASPLGQAYRAAMELPDADTAVLIDFTSYEPAMEEPMAFLATPVFDREQRLGVAVVQVNLNRINRIMDARTGMGQTGEMLLVGDDLLRRSDSAKSMAPEDTVRYGLSHPEESRIGLAPLDVLFGAAETGVTVAEDDAGNEALIAYAPLSIPDLRWGIIAKITLEEAFDAITAMNATAERAIARLLYLSDGIIMLAVLILLVAAYFVARSISNPLRRTVSILHDMAQGGGDVTQRLTVATRDEVGDLARWFNTFMDQVQEVYSALEDEVRVRKLAQTELEQSRQYYKMLIENAPDIIAVVDEAYTIQYLSPSFERVFGYAWEEALGQRILQFLHEDDMQAVHDVVEVVLKSPERPVYFKCRLAHQSGAWREVEMVLSNYLEEKVVEGIVLNLRDITEQEQADRILREYSQRLEEDVRQRTLELEKNRDDLAQALDRLQTTQQKLILNEKMASLGALTAGIAHEIKNPLNFITNFADLSGELAQELDQLLRDLEQDWPEETRAHIHTLLEDLRQNAARIVQHGRRADSIVRNMLLHSRGKPGKRRKTDINALLQEYVHLTFHGMRARYPSFNISMELDLDPKLPQAPVVAQDLARVFLNVLSNACYATHQRVQVEPDYKPRLQVRTRAQAGQIEIRIRDNGPGIPEALRKDIFNPFFTTKPAGEGTGLGLSISYDIIVQQHGGELNVNSSPGEYTEFVIVLPRDVSAGKQAPSP